MASSSEPRPRRRDPVGSQHTAPTPVDLSAAGQRAEPLATAFTVAFGAFLGLCLLKFGNPPILEKMVTPPANLYELVLGYPWPITWAYALLGAVAVLGALTFRRNPNAPGWLLVLPLAWLGWELLALTHTVSPQLSRPTVLHFAACVLCFYLGFFALGRTCRVELFGLGLLGGFLLMVVVGWEQHFGGLEESRRYFFQYVYPSMKEVPPDYLKKIQSDRIFGTLFYPNSLAGAILLLLPLALALVAQARQRLTSAARRFLLALIALAGLGCLYWSGSKGGWLLMLVLGLVTLWRVPGGKRLKLLLLLVVLVGGLAGFFWKYATFFQKGATSVSARFDYWRAALQTTAGHPVFGSGPGTFAIPYGQLKRPESEMARLTHNDYLEQASDSGLPAFLLYTSFILAALVAGWRRAPGWLGFALWLGVLGWALQGLVEFGLYIPALAWPAFTFLGWLLAQPRPSVSPIKSIDKSPPGR